MTHPAARERQDISPDRPMTEAERKWWSSLKRLMRAMPPDIEVHARLGDVGVAPKGAGQASADRFGDCDRYSETEWDSISAPRLDGRDSQL